MKGKIFLLGCVCIISIFLFAPITDVYADETQMSSEETKQTIDSSETDFEETSETIYESSMQISDYDSTVSDYSVMSNGLDGWTQNNGKWYYYENNIMLKDAERYIDNQWYYFNGDGIMATGWIIHHGNQYYYRDNGQMVHGLFKIDDIWYGFDEWSGVLLTGEHCFTENGINNWYYFWENDVLDIGRHKGQMATGWVGHHNNEYYYDPSNGVMAHGIKKIGDRYYGFNEWTGVILTGEHYFTDGSSDKWYYFYESDNMKGVMAVSEWVTHHGHWYYYESDGGMVHGLYEINGNLYMLDEWLGYTRSGWLPYRGEWYFMNNEGIVYRGEHYLDGHWYYFDEITGITANKGFTYHHNHWYFYNDYGYMQYGELCVNTDWYYFDPTTGIMSTGWTEHHENKYYYDQNGKMIHGTYEIEGREYYFDNTTGILKGAERIYQNPQQYYQIQDSISLSGGGYNLSTGYEGLKVAWVMRALGMGQGIGMPNSGGAYYSFTVASRVKSFQSKRGLKATGIVDLATWKAMDYSEYNWYNLGAYVSPMRINSESTKDDCINAMINTAYTYLGTSYIVGASGAPGTGVDCSGLVMQALYSAGLDLSPINPIRHASPGYEYESQNMYASSKFKTVSYENRQRGDLIFYSNANGVIIHVAIYLGNNQVIESWPNQVVVANIVNGQHSRVAGVRRPFV